MSTAVVPQKTVDFSCPSCRDSGGYRRSDGSWKHAAICHQHPVFQALEKDFEGIGSSNSGQG